MVVVESFLNKVGKAKIVLPYAFGAQTPFHVYFVQGSASEFRVDTEHGFIEPSGHGETELPTMILFEPKMYGKVLKGLLAVDTIEAQWLFDVIGKTPEYEPPVVQASIGRIMGLDEAELKRPQTAIVKKRDVIKEDFENAKIARPGPPNIRKLESLTGAMIGRGLRKIKKME
jgi:hypothetical protein